jgi:hypothetical protein
MQKDTPTPPSKEDLREDYRNDPGGYEDKWGITPDTPEPQTQDPHAPGKSN